MTTYYTPDQEQRVIHFVESLQQHLSSEQKAATAPLSRYMDSSQIAQRFHTPQLVQNPAGMVMLAETLAIAQDLGWQESPAKYDLEYAVFSTSALTHLVQQRVWAERIYQSLNPERKLSLQKIVLEPIFKLQRSQRNDEAYISYVNQHSLWRDIIIDRGNRLPLELAAELFYITQGDDDLQTRAKIREFLK